MSNSYSAWKLRVFNLFMAIQALEEHGLPWFMRIEANDAVIVDIA
jgi:hypothetical protein